MNSDGELKRTKSDKPELQLCFLNIFGGCNGQMRLLLSSIVLTRIAGEPRTQLAVGLSIKESCSGKYW